MPREPETPEPTDYQSGSDDEKCRTGKALIWEWLWIARASWYGLALQRDKDRHETHPYLKNVHVSFLHQRLPGKERKVNRPREGVKWCGKMYSL